MKRQITLLAAIAATIASYAQPSLDECRRLAREHYPAIRQYDLIRQTEQYTLSNAGRTWLPQVAFSAQATWQTDAPAFPDAFSGIFDQQGISIPGMRKDQYRMQIEVSQTLWDGGKSRADKLMAEAESAESRHTVDVDLFALDGRIDELYFGILLLDERIAQARLTIGLLESTLDKIRSLQRNGVALQTDADSVEAELLTAGQQLSQLESMCDSYRRMLSVFTGTDIGDKPLQQPDAEMPASMENRRPELNLLDARADLLTAREKMVKSSTMPRFGLFAQGYYGYPGLDYFKSMLNADWSLNAVVGIRMTWNFGGYYTRRNNLDRIATARRQLDVQRDIFLFNTELQSVEQNGEIERLRRALADDDRIVALRRSVREAAESKLRNGIIDTNDLLRKITDEQSAAVARSAREIELLKTIYELKHTINQ